jgi:hypothetical protein
MGEARLLQQAVNAARRMLSPGCSGSLRKTRRLQLAVNVALRGCDAPLQPPAEPAHRAGGGQLRSGGRRLHKLIRHDDAVSAAVVRGLGGSCRLLGAGCRCGATRRIAR